MLTHSETRLLPYTPAQLYALVADIEKYPEFLPWCMGARILARRPDEVEAELLIGLGMLRERYSSRVRFMPQTRIDVTLIRGPFRHLGNFWEFQPDDGGCRLTFRVEFEFRSGLLTRLIGGLFHEAVRRMVAAFETRARKLYAPKPNTGI